MDHESLAGYVSGFDGDDRLIRFHANPKEGGEPFDLNSELRDRVIECVLSTHETVPLSLLRALFKAIIECADHAWSVDERVAPLARMMLISGTTTVISEYIDGCRCSFDTMCATSFEDCPISLAEECLEFAKERRARSTGEEDMEKWDFAIERFKTMKEQSSI